MISEVPIVDSDWCVIIVIITTQSVSKPNLMWDMEQSYTSHLHKEKWLD